VPYTAVANWFSPWPRLGGGDVDAVGLGGTTLFSISGFHWRSAFLALGLAFYSVIAAAIFLRRQPEDLGMFPDGIAPTSRSAEAATSESQTSTTGERSWSRAEALRTTALWLLVLSVFLASLGTGGIAFHTVAYFTHVKIAPPPPPPP
jgi:hypothetical protein